MSSSDRDTDDQAQRKRLSGTHSNFKAE